jgi:glycosyltransferase involved in cell wall biosynthesis
MPFSEPFSDNTSARVAILLGTKNGARFLNDQLCSYLTQSHQNWALHVSDDASVDETCEVIRRFGAEHQIQIPLRKGPNAGFARNFVGLAQDPDITGDYFAFSDQDDVWYEDKLERAIGFLASVPAGTAAMYCSRTEVVDEHRNHRGFSPVFRKTPSFKNALVQNIGGGNTMVFNLAAKRLLEAAGDVRVVSHDWWVYQIVSGVGGVVFYDPMPSLKYRQHGNNVLGANSDLKARLLRMDMILQGRLRKWNDTNLSALRVMLARLHPVSVRTMDYFVAARSERPLPVRLYYFLKSGVYRQSFGSQFALILATCLRRI